MQLHELNQQVIEKVETSVQPVVDEVVNSLASAEISRRAAIISRAVLLSARFQEEITAIEPDVESFNQKGEPVPNSYSEEQLAKLNGLIAKRDAVDAAGEAALEFNTPSAFEYLEKVLQDAEAA